MFFSQSINVNFCCLICFIMTCARFPYFEYTSQKQTKKLFTVSQSHFLIANFIIENFIFFMKKYAYDNYNFHFIHYYYY